MFVPEYHNYLAEGIIHHNSGGGKTILGMLALAQRMDFYFQRDGKRYGYGVAEPTFQMLEKIIIESADPDRPSLIDFLSAQGYAPSYKAFSKIITTNRGKIYLGSADKPNTLQGPALIWYWLDEAGMMALDAYWTALQRVAFYDGQVMLTTTPYNRGWLLSEVWNKRFGPDINAHRWRSIDNPAFPKESYERMKNMMAKHRHAMMFDASFERPEGMIYNAFDDEHDIIEPFSIPKSWPRYVGMDFGPVHTVALWIAQEPSKKNPRRYLYREYLRGGLTTPEHAKVLLKLSKGERIAKIVGGAPSEDQWRRDLRAAGWHCERPPVKEVEVGIDRVITLHKTRNYKVFNTCKRYISEKADYHRKLDANQQVTDVIENKEQYHNMDAERYVASYLTQRGSFAFDVV